MKSLPQFPGNNLTDPQQMSNVLIAGMEIRLAQLAGQLLDANASLEREIIDHQAKQDEFCRSTEQLWKGEK